MCMRPQLQDSADSSEKPVNEQADTELYRVALTLIILMHFLLILFSRKWDSCFIPVCTLASCETTFSRNPAYQQKTFYSAWTQITTATSYSWTQRIHCDKHSCLQGMQAWGYNTTERTKHYSVYYQKNMHVRKSLSHLQTKHMHKLMDQSTFCTNVCTWKTLTMRKQKLTWRGTYIARRDWEILIVNYLKNCLWGILLSVSFHITHRFFKTPTSVTAFTSQRALRFHCTGHKVTGARLKLKIHTQDRGTWKRTLSSAVLRAGST